MIKPIIVDIETAPIVLNEDYFSLSDSDKLKKLNPIESRIVAIGVRCNNTNFIYGGDFTEIEILEKFWNLCSGDVVMVGFNIVDFDLPFIVARSLINNVKITPINLKSDVIDIRQNINCFKYGNVRGKLKEYAQVIGLEILETTGNDVAKLVYDDNYSDLHKYLIKDIEITDALYKRCKELNILQIRRW